jgi:hypothetical protein
MPYIAQPLGSALLSISMINFRILHECVQLKCEEHANRILIWKRNTNIHFEESNETEIVTIKWILRG